MHRRQSDVLMGGVGSSPLSSRYGPCLFGGVASGFCFVLAAVGLGTVSTQVIWRLRSPGSLARTLTLLQNAKARSAERLN